jgi:hypothetical protein
MRRIALLTTCLLALLLSAVSASAAKHTKHTKSANCSTIHSQLFAADTQAQVYVALAPSEAAFYYGCVYGVRHTYTLGEVHGCGGGGGGGRCYGIRAVTLAGTLVAYQEFINAPQVWLIVVRDLRTGRILRRVPTNAPGPPNTSGSVEALVLKPDGAVAWIAQATLTKTSGERREYEVYAADATGESRLLAAGLGIDPTSLALAGSTLFWTQTSQAMSTPLN